MEIKEESEEQDEALTPSKLKLDEINIDSLENSIQENYINTIYEQTESNNVPLSNEERAENKKSVTYINTVSYNYSQSIEPDLDNFNLNSNVKETPKGDLIVIRRSENFNILNSSSSKKSYIISELQLTSNKKSENTEKLTIDKDNIKIKKILNFNKIKYHKTPKDANHNRMCSVKTIISPKQKLNVSPKYKRKLNFSQNENFNYSHNQSEENNKKIPLTGTNSTRTTSLNHLTDKELNFAIIQKGKNKTKNNDSKFNLEKREKRVSTLSDLSKRLISNTSDFSDDNIYNTCDNHNKHYCNTIQSEMSHQSTISSNINFNYMFYLIRVRC